MSAQVLAGNFRFQNIDVPGSTSTSVGGINNLGQMAGFFHDSSGGVHGYVQDGADIRVFDFPNAHKTFGEVINNAGMVAGAYSDGVRFHGFTLKDGVFTTIDFPGSVFSDVVDLNDRGDLAGVWEDPSFGLHGFTFDKNGFTSIDDPAQTWPTPSTQSLGINDGETVNGLFLDVNDNFHGFSLKNGIFQTIDVPGAVGTAPEGLNEAEDMVGLFIGQDGVQHGFLKRGDVFTSLDFPGAVGRTFPFQVNDSGTIVGIYIDDQRVTHSFRADPLPGVNPAGNDSTPAINTIQTQSCSASNQTDPERIRNPRACAATN
jgi:hypothetical protein